MRINRKLKTNFEKVSRAYNRTRLTYPDKLVKDIIKISKLKAGAKILDIGCGTGQMTKLFAAS
ncbi:MAG: hypothetical protein HY513_05955 [Candidatus Aenigmarchaeota archaeon]|nr:hypothetical protein [Candidatus Aenigmarchaeota archaeon]